MVMWLLLFYVIINKNEEGLRRNKTSVDTIQIYKLILLCQLLWTPKWLKKDS